MANRLCVFKAPLLDNGWVLSFPLSTGAISVLYLHHQFQPELLLCHSLGIKLATDQSFQLIIKFRQDHNHIWYHQFIHNCLDLPYRVVLSCSVFAACQFYSFNYQHNKQHIFWSIHIFWCIIFFLKYMLLRSIGSFVCICVSKNLYCLMFLERYVRGVVVQMINTPIVS